MQLIRLNAQILVDNGQCIFGSKLVFQVDPISPGSGTEALQATSLEAHRRVYPLFCHLGVTLDAL